MCFWKMYFVINGNFSPTLFNIPDGTIHACDRCGGWSVSEWTACMQRAGFVVKSCELLDNIAIPRSTARNSVPDTLSKLLTMFYRLKGRITPRLIRERRRYRKALLKHGGEDRYIEARLFVLVKASGKN